MQLNSQVRETYDDLLIANALLLGSDYVITSDKDLLVIRSLLDRPRIVTPAEFLALLEEDRQD